MLVLSGILFTVSRPHGATFTLLYLRHSYASLMKEMVSLEESQTSLSNKMHFEIPV